MSVDVAFTQFNGGVCLAGWRFNKHSPSLQLREATSSDLMSLFSLSLTQRFDAGTQMSLNLSCRSLNGRRWAGAHLTGVCVSGALSGIEEV